MKKYWLFLDEGGDFDSDLMRRNSNECLVGGFLAEAGQAQNFYKEDFTKRVIVSSWCKTCKEFSKFNSDLANNQDKVLKVVNHATEIKKQSSKYREFYPSVLTSLLSKLVGSGASLVIFQNNNKSNVVDSTTTYLNILVEGVFFVLKKLALRYGEPIELNLVIGERRDMSREAKNAVCVPKEYIPQSEYKRRVDEKITLLKAVDSDTVIKKSEIKLSLSIDKEDSRLILSDYICNYYFTRSPDSDLFKHYGEKIGKLFKGESAIIYTMGDNSDLNRLNRYRSAGMYSSILIELCYGEISKTLYNDTIEFFIAKKQIDVVEKAFRAFYQHLDELITKRRNFAVTKRLLDNATVIVNKIKDVFQEEVSTIKCIEFDIWMYYETMYSHMGNYGEQKSALEKAQQVYSQINNHIENFDRFFIMENRKAIFLNYTYDFKEAERICLKAERILDDVNRLAIGEIRENDFESDDIKSDQLGKMYGTHVQTAVNLFNQGLVSYEYVRKISNLSIKCFSHKNDICRQFQYLAALETSAGNIDTALECLNKGISEKNWEKISLSYSDTGVFFVVYHLSNIALAAVKSGRSESAKMILDRSMGWLEGFFKQLSSNTFDYGSVMPNGIAAFNLALVYSYIRGPKYIDKLLNLADCIEEQQITFYPQLYADIALCCCKYVSNEWSKRVDYSFVTSKIESVFQKNFSNSTKEFFVKWQKILREKGNSALVEFAKTRLY